LAQRGLSLAGAVLLTAVIVAASFTLVFHEGVKRGSMPLISLTITTLAAMASSLHWLARPHVFTFLYLAIWIILLERVRKRKRTPVWIPGLTMLLWSNTHGAFIAGFVTWGAYMGGELLESWEHGKWEVERIKTWGLLGLVSLS
jgi:predicted membrane-bound mannosyltransferase